MEKVNLGIIGLGFVGKVHLRNGLNLKSVKLIAVADISKKALSYAKELGVKQLFTDYHELLKQPEIDAVVISLPTHLHADCAISAAEMGKHVFLEKPLARNPKEGQEIVSAVRENGVKFMVGYPLRYSPEFVNIKRRMESGALGDIQTAYAVNIGAGPFFHRADSNTPNPVPEWWLDRGLTGGGALMDLGSHMINLTRWYFGEIKSIRTYLGYRFNLDIEDYAICIANFESGVTATIDVGWFSQETAIGVELHGTVNNASFFMRPSSRINTAIRLILGRTPKFFLSYREELLHFINCIRSDNVPFTSGYDALKDLEAINEAYKNQINL